MQQFALASVYPRSIAWLIRAGDWNHFEKVINYNCAMIGGYFNVVIPLTEHNTISEEYQRFLVDYDPDLVVLAPGITPDQLEAFSNCVHSFGIIPWDSVSSIATLDPESHSNGMNAPVDSLSVTRQDRFIEAFVAVAGIALPDTSRLALVACGDVQPGDISLDATGYREQFLIKLLADEYKQKYIEAYLEDEQFISALDRYQLSEIISEKYKFPLSGAVAILNTCFKLQNLAVISTRRSFIGLTVMYHKIHGAVRHKMMKFEERPPAIVILVSDSFGLEEALLFWNLRANEIYVAWLPFSALENEQEEIVKWLDSESGGVFYGSNNNNRMSIVFTSSDEEIPRLQIIVNQFQDKRLGSFGKFIMSRYVEKLL